MGSRLQCCIEFSHVHAACTTSLRIANGTTLDTEVGHDCAVIPEPYFLAFSVRFAFRILKMHGQIGYAVTLETGMRPLYRCWHKLSLVCMPSAQEAARHCA